MLFFLASCVKEKDDADIQLNTQACPLIILLAENFEYTFDYDDQQNLVYVFIDDNSGSTREYYANNFLENKVSGYVAITNGYDDFYETYEWGSNALTIKYYSKDDYGQYFLETRYEYTLNSQGQVTRRDWYNDSGSGLELVGYRKYTWINGNITKREYWYSGKKNAVDRRPEIDYHEPDMRFKSAEDTWSYTATFEYDTKNNALASVGLFWPDDTFTKNNITHAIFEYSDGTTGISDFYYEYNANDYPDSRQEYYYYESNPVEIYSQYYFHDCPEEEL
jgi:hypothetical protein